MQPLTQKQKLGLVKEKFFSFVASSSFRASEGFQVKHNDFKDYARSQEKGVDLRIFERNREFLAMELKNLKHFNKPYGTNFVENHIFHRFENNHAKIKVLGISFIEMIPKEIVKHCKYVDCLLTPDNQRIWIFETGKLIGKKDFPRKRKPSKFFYHIKNQFKRFLEDIELQLAQEQTQIDNWIDQQQKNQADQFFNSSLYQSIKNVDVPTHNTVKETTHDMGSKNWLQKMTENMTRLDFIEDSDVYEKLNKLKKHPLYYEFS